MRNCRRKPCPVRISPFARPCSGEELGSLIGFAVVRDARFRRWCWLVAPGETAVVETLGEKDDVGDRVVYGKYDLVASNGQRKPRETQQPFWAGRTMVGRTPCRTAPMILNTSPRSHTMMNWTDRASALLRWKFWMICGEKTTTVLEGQRGAMRHGIGTADPNKQWTRNCSATRSVYLSTER